MDWQASPYTLPAGLAAGLAAGLGVLVWRRVPRPGAAEFTLFAFAVADWCFANAVEYARADLPGKLLWTRIEYIGVVSVPVLWLAFVVAYTRTGRALPRRQLASLFIIPAITLALAWTNDKHGLIWSSVRLAGDESMRFWSADHGAWFWVHSAYEYAVLAVATGLIIRLLRRSSSLVHRQAVLLLVGMASPWIANVLYLTRMNPLPDVDLTPFGFSVGALAVGTGFFSFRLFNVVPIAREALVQHLPDAVIVLDSDDGVVDANPAAERLMGRSARELVGHRVGAGTSGRTYLFGTGVPLEAGEHVLVDGQTSRHLEVRRVALDEHRDHPVGGLIVVRDVTDRAQAEASRIALVQEQTARTTAEAASAEHRASEERLRLALAAGRMGTWDWDLRGRCFRGSSESATLLDLPSEVVEVPQGIVLARIHTADRRRVWRQVAAALRTSADELSVEFRIASASGDGPRWVAIRGHPFVDTDTRRSRLMGVIMDITERIEAEQRREVFARAEHLRVLGQMAGGIAHDLNQSLALVSGHAELARQELARPEPDRRHLDELFEVVVRAAQDGGQSIKRLLAFVRSRQAGASEVVDVGHLLHEIADLTAPRWRDAAQADGRPIDLHVDAVAGVSILADRHVLREALTNLVFNAVDALPWGGSISLRNQPIGDKVAIEVQDTGTGMTPEVRAQALEPFFTTKGQRGTGLGLAQVLGAVQQHGGEVELESAPGRGTAIRIVLPTVPSTAPKVVQPANDESASAIASLRVLAVDDEERLARMMALLLSSVGHCVTTASSAEEALTVLARESHDLLITDLGLGTGMNGWDLADEVRRRWPDIRIVLATGWGADIDPEQARGRGVDAVVAKPYQAKELRQIVADIARSRAPD